MNQQRHDTQRHANNGDADDSNILAEIKLIYRLGKWVFGAGISFGVTGLVVLIQGNMRLESLQKWQERTVPVIETIPLIARDLGEVKLRVGEIIPRVDFMWYRNTNH